MNSTAMLVLTVWCAALSAFDVRWRRLPDALTLPGAVIVLGYGFAVGTPGLAVLGALLLAVPYLLLHLCCPAALGAGDVKLALGLGAATALGGAQSWAWAAIAAPLLTACAGVGTLLVTTYRMEWPGYQARLPVGAQPHRQPGSRWLALPVIRIMILMWRPAWASGARTPAVRGGGAVVGEVATLPHGPAMCAASVLALLAGR
ncbi:prepilin peptidase [Nocardia tengchongensis]|uniref:prepilin peptidase n=1 Tax=Nocardia tengchongensis TaxID=2055889 RepID=UPI0036C5FF3B